MEALGNARPPGLEGKWRGKNLLPGRMVRFTLLPAASRTTVNSKNRFGAANALVNAGFTVSRITLKPLCNRWP